MFEPGLQVHVSLIVRRLDGLISAQTAEIKLPRAEIMGYNLRIFCGEQIEIYTRTTKLAQIHMALRSAI